MNDKNYVVVRYDWKEASKKYLDYLRRVKVSYSYISVHAYMGANEVGIRITLYNTWNDDKDVSCKTRVYFLEEASVADMIVDGEFTMATMVCCNYANEEYKIIPIEKVHMSEFFDKSLIKPYNKNFDISSLYPKFIMAKGNTCIDEWYEGCEALKKITKGIKDMETKTMFVVEIKKVISSGKKTIVIFSDGEKVMLTDEKPGVDSLDLFNRIMFAVIKKNVTSKQFEFFCDYCSIDGSPTENVDTNNQLQKKMLRAFVKAVIPDKDFWPAWSRYINHLIYELSDKEQKKIFVTQEPKKKR